MILLVFILAAIIGGSNAPLVKLGISEFPPVILVFLRFVLAGFIILPFVFIKTKWTVIAKPSKYILLASFGFAMNVTLFAIGIQHTSIIMSQVLYMPTSLIVAVIGFLFLGERLSRHQIIGLIITMVGMAILIQGSIKTQDVLSFGKPLGNILMIIALFFWSSYLVLSRRESSIYPPLTITFYNFAITTLMVLPLAFFEFNSSGFMFSDITQRGLFGLLGLVFLSSITIYFLYQWLIKHTSAFISSLLLYVTPVFSTIYGIIFFGEKLTTGFLIGGLLILLGVFVATSYSQAKKHLRIMLP